MPQNRTNLNNATTQAVKVIPHFPPTNKDFVCTELHTPDGIYPLLHETFYDTIAPQFTTGTRVSIINVKDDLLSRTTDDDSDEDGFTLNKSAALPIPNTAATVLNNKKQYIRTPLTASISSSSLNNQTGLHIVTSPQKIMTHANGNNASPFMPNSPSFNMTPTTPTFSSSSNLQQTPQQHYASGSYMMGSSQDFSTRDEYTFSSSSYNGNSSSVGSISSLFGRSLTTQPTNSSVTTSTAVTKTNTNTPQLSNSYRNNHILSSSISSTSKPKNHLSKTNSTFVLRFLVHDQLQKMLAAKSLDDEYMFFNLGSSFIWVDSKNKPKVCIHV